MEKLNLPEPLKCFSKNGKKMNQFFIVLKGREAGDVSVLDRHSNTHRKMMENEQNMLKEVNLREEGRLKILKSELNRARDLVGVKDKTKMDDQLTEHKKRIKLNYRKLLEQDPDKAAKIKLDRILPKIEINSSLKSPSRSQLQDYDSKEAIKVPNPAAYRPRYD